MDIQEFHDSFLKAVEDVKSIFKEDIKFKPDHISLLTTSGNDYEKAKQEFKDLIVNSKEITHSGRRITLGTFKLPISESGYTLEKLEISEPKPNRIIRKRKIDHIAFVPEDYKVFLKYVEEKKVDIYDEMQIGSVTICKLKTLNSRLEFRSSPEFVTKPETTNTTTTSVELVKYKKEAEENKEKTLRALADYQNLRKRMDTDREAFQFIANTALIAKLLDVSDDFSRADEHVSKEEDSKKVKSAYKSVKDKILGVINDFGLVEIPLQIGDHYDMHSMEAIGTLPTEIESENDTVKHIANKGYKYSNKDQIIRPARVIVAKYNLMKKEIE